MESIITLQMIDRCVVDLIKYIEDNTTSTKLNNHTILPSPTAVPSAQLSTGAPKSGASIQDSFLLSCGRFWLWV
ncbi:hypothetical protein HYFRA_00010995 [Hymenoscyphus fraxineus]|uniref:Uncharacterized protein n=1 Tax=Hymenoscyphus fraxineus TaxID=746836 RepID=A0A9N9PJE9_9HELO|nr:hypothetical protein HYFRA_00010995 [Hymenoscyphus fraxineus]